MAKSFNQAIIMGNLTRDPEMRTTPNGQNVASFAVATNRTWQNASGEKQEAVEFHEVVAWAKLAELATQYLAKGRKVLVVGRLQTQQWEKDGVKQRRTEIVASDISFLDGPSGSRSGDGFPADESQETPAPKKPTKAKSEDVVIEDLPDGDQVNLDDIPF